MPQNSIDNSFSKDFRLITKSDFQNLRNGSKRYSSGVLLFYLKENNYDHARLGLAISKKAGNAVKRNKIKRKLRDLFRLSPVKYESKDLLITLNYRTIQRDKLGFENVYSQISDSFNKLPIT